METSKPISELTPYNSIDDELSWASIFLIIDLNGFFFSDFSMS